MTKKQAEADAQAEVVDLAAVNEPTRSATATDDREEPAFVVATQELFANGVRAHMPGDLVPSVNVEAHGWGSAVRAL